MEFHYTNSKDITTTIAGNAGCAVALLVTSDKQLSDAGVLLDKEAGNLISKALTSKTFKGKAAQTLCVTAPEGLAAHCYIIIGLGDEKDINALSYEHAAGEAVKLANKHHIADLVIITDKIHSTALGVGEAEAHAALGAKLGSYRFDKYFTKKKDEDKPSVQKVIIAGHNQGAEAYHARLDALAEGIITTRNLVSEPANVLHPESYAEICQGLSKYGIDVEVLGEKRMAKLGMGALLGVGQGSIRESQLVVMRYNGADDKKAQPVAFVGKGVTFDTGGISIKPAKGMEDMKWDMGGSAAVVGVMKTLAKRKAKVNAVGVIGLVENMPDGNAQRPGDVVTSYSGQTIEVLNTDAEGRLVLADALWYCQEQFHPKFMIDLATLTGAIIVSLGAKYAGLFSNNDELAERILGLGKETGDETWRFPLDDYYDKQIDSTIADMQNIGADREAGSITAAQFLQRFVNNVPWVHLDIAGTAWRSKHNAITPTGATGYGVRLLDRLVEKYYEV
jgi:leucyl aminopeptidase